MSKEKNKENTIIHVFISTPDGNPRQRLLMGHVSVAASGSSCKVFLGIIVLLKENLIV